MEWADYRDANILQYVLVSTTCPSKLLTYTPDILDGMMIVLAMYTFNFMHPGMLLQKTTLPSEKIAMDSRSSSNLV